MPQPLSKVAPNASPTFSTETASKRSVIASQIVSLLSKWPWIETEQELLIVRLTGGTSDAALAIFDGLQADNVKREAINRAARVSLVEGRYKILQAILSAVYQSARARNAFAHSVWGYCNELPNELLLISPYDLATSERNFRRMRHAYLTGRATEFQDVSVTVDISKVYVYYESEIKKLDILLSQTIALLKDFANLLDADDTFKGRIPEIEGHKIIGTTSFALRRLLKSDLYRSVRAQLRDNRKNERKRRRG